MPSLAASHRLRIGRYSEQNRIYLLSTNTRCREPIFNDFALGRLVVAQFRAAQDQVFADSLAWVVMPDHFHWLIELRRGGAERVDAKNKVFEYQSGEPVERSQDKPLAEWLS